MGADDWKFFAGFLGGFLGFFLAYFIFHSLLHKGSLTEIRRDEKGRIVEILERLI